MNQENQEEKDRKVEKIVVRELKDKIPFLLLVALIMAAIKIFTPL